jgi:hypothetical protein
MACPHAAYEGVGLQVWSAVANMLNRQSSTVCSQNHAAARLGAETENINGVERDVGRLCMYL